jgi:dihydrolipoamide dehydrogenase
VKSIKTDVVVLGAGPGGYAAAFYAAELGKSVIMVEMDSRLGGVCLNRGCIPSKALLHAAGLISEAEESEFRGIHFEKPTIDLDRMRAWKESILEKLAQGIVTLAQRRHVEILHGRGYLEDASTLRVETSDGQQYVHFTHAVLATGSRSAMPPAFDLGNKRIMTSTEALEIEDIPERLLIVGGGYIGMELGTVYKTLGSKIVLVEAQASILQGADPDLVKPILNYAAKNFEEVRTGAKVLKMATSGKKINVMMEWNGGKKEELYDRVLVAVGRTPNSRDLGLENTRVLVDDRGFIKVNERQQTDEPSVFAVGDVAGGVLLAHKASKEARIAVEVMCGENSEFRDIIMPAVVFTNPELAWCGLTEAEARERSMEVQIVKFPWMASGRAMSFDRTDGLTKLIIQPATERILGVGIVGAGASELISEAVVAIEMGATARDMAESVHPHPTLSETLSEAAEMYYGYATHAMSKRRVAKEA